MASQFKGRREDERLVTGRGRYSDDWSMPGQLYASFKRSDRAHARIRSISLAAAEQTPGVVAIVTGKDIAEAGFRTLPPIAPLTGREGKKILVPERPLLALDRVRLAGEEVALVVARNPRGRARRRRPDRDRVRGPAGDHRVRQGARARRRVAPRQHSGQRLLRLRVRRRRQDRRPDRKGPACRARRAGKPARGADADGAARRARLVRRQVRDLRAALRAPGRLRDARRARRDDERGAREGPREPGRRRRRLRRAHRAVLRISADALHGQAARPPDQVALDPLGGFPDRQSWPRDSARRRAGVRRVAAASSRCAPTGCAIPAPISRRRARSPIRSTASPSAPTCTRWRRSTAAIARS